MAYRNGNGAPLGGADSKTRPPSQNALSLFSPIGIPAARIGADRSPGKFPELDCVRDRLPSQVIAAVEERAAQLGIGAERVLIAAGFIDEDHYVYALSRSLGFEYELFDDRERASCPLDDKRLLLAAKVGVLPLTIGDEEVFVVAPHSVRQFLALLSTRPNVRFRVTSSARLNLFVADKGRAVVAYEATSALRNRWPELSAGSSSRPFHIACGALLATFATALVAFPSATLIALQASLATAFLAALGLMSTADLHADAGALRELAEQSNAWPFEEARKIVARLKSKPKDEVIFETGYGPSGLPHIGTFGEVARTTMVRHAFRVLTDDKVKTHLIAFSDDMDGLRKVPDNIPNKDLVAQHLGKPLTKVPDPFGTHASFGEHNNARLRAFLDQFGFEYEFLSSTECYTSGRFDTALLKVLERFDAVMEIMLPSLREERAQTYSPFLPISPRTGEVLQVPVTGHDAKAGAITYEDPDTEEQVTTIVTGGRTKLQWKPDWAMRWVALGIDYEMAGKDLIDSVKLSGEICRALGGRPPEGFNYELFLDEKGQKISKSKGNGLTIDEWLRYASPESLSLFMYREPKSAKRLYFDVIPRHVDEYQQYLEGYQRQDGRQRLSNPVWHVHSGAPPKPDMPITFSMLLTLVSSSNAENAETLWGFIGRYRPGVTPQTHPKLDALVGYAIHYFRDFVLPAKKFREPGDVERAALIDLRDALSQLSADAPAEKIQEVVYEIGRREPFLDYKKPAKDGRPGVSLDWFNMLYQVLLGQEKGPRFGSFVAVYGLSNTVEMIDGALARSA